MENPLKNLFAVADLRNRILFTLALSIVLNARHRNTPLELSSIHVGAPALLAQSLLSGSSQAPSAQHLAAGARRA